MRVLHVLSGLHAAGIESLALQMIRHAPAGVHSELLNTNRSAQAMAQAFEQLEAEGALQALHQWPVCDGPQLAWRSFRLCLWRRPDALLIYPCSRPLLWLALGARLAGVHRLAVALQNTAPANPRALASWHRLLVWFQRLGVLAVPCTQAIIDSLQPLPRGLHIGPVIPNGCDTAAIAKGAAATRAQRPPGDARRVLMVARLDRIKDQATLIRAFAAARQPGWELQLVGDGPERTRLESLARGLGLDPAQVFLGRRADIPELLGQADLFAFSTTASEGFGIALIEALAAGLPVIASDVPACREVLFQGELGSLVVQGQTDQWAKTLEYYFNSIPHENKAAIRCTAAKFNIKTISDKWMQVLHAR